MKKILFFHTSNKIIPSIEDLIKKEQIIENELSKFEIYNFVDEVILNQLFNNQDSQVESALQKHIEYFNSLNNIDLIQCTCTSLSPAILKIRSCSNLPLYSVDEEMVNEIVNNYKNPLIIFTVKSTIQATLSLFEEQDYQENINHIFLPEAFEWRMKDDIDRHNEIIADAIKNSPVNPDVVVLPQSSTLVSLEYLRKHFSLPILNGIEFSIKTRIN